MAVQGGKGLGPFLAKSGRGKVDEKAEQNQRSLAGPNQRQDDLVLNGNLSEEFG